MLPVYLGSLVFGGMLVVLSLVFGGDDLDVDADLDVDVDMDADLDVDADAGYDVAGVLQGAGDAAHDGLWLPFLSMRFWTFALASFGLTGTLLHLLVGLAAVVFPVALLTGVALGTFAAWVFRKLKSETITAEVRLRQFVGTEARVLLPITPDRPGKIVVDTLAGQVELYAQTQDERPIERGQRVLIADVAGRTANVTSLPRPDRPPPTRQGVTT